jgi:hypothetical protein
VNAGPVPQDLGVAGKVLATDQNGLTLREAPEGGLYGWNQIDWARGEKYLKVDRPDGAAVEILLGFGSASVRLKDIIVPCGPGSLGTIRIRSVYRLLQRAYPNIEFLSGIRVSGARWNKPRELMFSLRRLAGVNIAGTSCGSSAH